MARILSIEDDPDLQHLMGRVLQQHGYEVHYAFNGKEGYEKVLSLHPDLIILDLMLPVMHGIEVLKSVQANRETRDIPVIVITAYGDEVQMLEHSVKALGAVEYLRKPLVIEELLRTIRLVLSRLAEPEAAVAEIRKGAVRADPRYRTVWVNDRLMATLPPKRFELLKILLEEKGPDKKTDLLARIWGEGHDENVLVKMVQRLREDLGSEEGRRIQTALDGYELVG
jgi:DNA-binding response OmpR family regulator